MNITREFEIEIAEDWFETLEYDFDVTATSWHYVNERQTRDYPGGITIEDIEYEVTNTETGETVEGIELTDREFSDLEDEICEIERDREDYDPRSEPEYWD